MITITCLILIMLTGNLFVSVVNTRHYFSTQMSVVAEDTATSLGLTISHAAKSSDIAQVQTMIDVIFDSGYYQSIIYQNLDGEVLVSRARDINIEGVPQWFVDAVPIPARSGSAEVISGWFRLGELRVVSHPGYVYLDLWRVFIEQLWLFAFTAALCYGLAGLGLKFLLKPLKRIEQQALAISKKEFQVQKQLPRTPEFRQVAQAMNQMVLKIKEMLQHQVKLTEDLRLETHMDALTQLPNRQEFDARLEAWMKSEQAGSPCVLILLHARDVDVINDKLGREAGDRLILDTADILKDLVSDMHGALIARRGGADFSLFLPGVVASEVPGLLKWFKQQLMGCVSIQSAAQDFSNGELFYIGAATSKKPCLVETMLSAADVALREYKHGGASDWVIYPIGETSQDIRPAGEWLDYLQSVLESGGLMFNYQAVTDTKLSSALQLEVLARIKDGEKLINAGVFWPLVERYGLAIDMDRRIIGEVLAVMKAHPAKIFSVNVSPQSIVDEGFVSWLDKTLASTDVPLENINFEVSEKLLKLDPQSVEAFIDVIKRYNAGFGLDHFGLTPSALGRLHALAIDYVKIDRRFISNIQDTPDNRFYVQVLVQIAHSCDVLVIAEGVESEQEWQTMLSLNVDGGQGYWLAEPVNDF